MKIKSHQLILCAFSALLLGGCGPKKEEGTTVPEQTQEAPVAAPDERTHIPEQHEGPNPHTQGSTLTPQQQDKLKIDEENVFDETPPG